jgi:glutaredoxin 3
MLLTLLLLITGNITPIYSSVSSSASSGAAIEQEQPQIESIALYYSPKCPHSQRVLAYMRSQNITIPLKNVTQDKEAKEVLRTVGGYMIVPCLIVNGKPIYQDSDIIQWLSEHKSQLPHG